MGRKDARKLDGIARTASTLLSSFQQTWRTKPDGSQGWFEFDRQLETAANLAGILTQVRGSAKDYQLLARAQKCRGREFYRTLRKEKHEARSFTLRKKAIGEFVLSIGSLKTSIQINSENKSVRKATIAMQYLACAQTRIQLAHIMPDEKDGPYSGKDEKVAEYECALTDTEQAIHYEGELHAEHLEVQGECYNSIGDLLEDLDQNRAKEMFEKVVEVYESLVKMQDDEVSTLAKLGEAYCVLAEAQIIPSQAIDYRDKALEIYTRAKEIDPTNTEVNEAITNLQEEL